MPRFMRKSSRTLRKKWLLSAITCLLLCSAGTTYALAEYYTVGVSVNYNGSEVGVVRDTTVVQTAKKIVTDQIVTSEPTESLLNDEEYSVSITKKENLLTETALADALVETSDELIPAAAIYVDGDFYAAVDEPAKAEEVLDEVLEEHSTGAKDETLTFTGDVEVVEGICPTEELSNQEEVKEEATEALSVSSVFVENKEQDIPFSTQTIESDEYPAGVTLTTQEGQDGLAEITEQVTCINEEEIAREVVETEVKTEPVEEIITVGTGEFSLAAETAFLTQPLEGCYLSSPYGGRWGRNHNGVDLCLSGGTLGADIVAAYAGTVITATHSDSGYGNHVEIDHGNGYTTLYAHMTDLAVSEGDVLAAGALVGHAGSTGNSTGPHLHFEIRENGSAVDPLPYLPDVDSE